MEGITKKLFCINKIFIFRYFPTGGGTNVVVVSGGGELVVPLCSTIGLGVFMACGVGGVRVVRGGGDAVVTVVDVGGGGGVLNPNNLFITLLVPFPTCWHRDPPWPDLQIHWNPPWVFIQIPWDPQTSGKYI